MIDAAALRRLLTAVSSGLRGIRTAPVVFTTSVVIMTGGLLMMAACLLVLQNMRGTLDRLGDDFTVIAYLPPKVDPDPERVAELERRFGALEGVDDVIYVSRSEALDRLRSDFGDQDDVLEGLEVIPLPAAFELRLVADARNPERVRALASAVREIDGIDDARYREEWVSQYAGLVRVAEIIVIVISIGAFLVLSVTVGATVRLAVYARADEIEIQRLVGAGSLYVRLPFYIQGALQGALGALASTLLLYGLYQLYTYATRFAAPLEILTGGASLVFLGAFEIFALVFIGVGLGVAGATLWLVRLEQT